MNKRIVTTALASAVGASLVFGLTACGADEPSNGFKQNCKQAGGKIERENDFQSLGMAPVAFVAGKGGGRGGGRGSSSNFRGGSPSKSKPKSGKTSKGIKSKSKHDDNDFLCVKNGKILFEEDE